MRPHRGVAPMVNTALLIAVVLLALLIGAAIPVLYHLAQTLKIARRVLDETGPRLDRTLDQVAEAAARLNRMGTALEEQAATLKPLVEAASGLGRSLNDLRH